MTIAHQYKSVMDRLEEGILAILLAFMTCITFVQVVLRYVFNSGLVWSLEATTYAAGWLLLIGISYGVRTKAHIAVDLVTNKLSGSTKHYVALLAIALCLLYAGLMFYGSYVLIDRMFMLGNDARDIPLPKWLLTSIMPVGFALLAFRFSQAGMELLKSSKNDTDNDENAVWMAPDNDQIHLKGNE